MGAIGAIGAIGAMGAMGAMGALTGCAGSSTPADKVSIEASIAPTNGQLAPATAPFDAARAWKDLEAQVAFGPRPAGSAALQKTREYILAELKKAGIATRQQIFIAKTPLGETSMANVIATIPGRRPERLAIASHFDTKLFKDFRFVGASDGASSTAALLELARVLKGRQNEFTLELIFFDGEEAVVEWTGNDHTYGSRHYVEVAKKNGTLSSLKALVLVDMIGDRDLQIKRDTNSTTWLTDIIWDAARQQKQTSVFQPLTTQIEDDHLPFIEARVPAVDIIDLEYEAWHTAGDTLDKVSARSLQTVADVLLAALPQIESRVK